MDDQGAVELTVKQAAERLNVDPGTVRRWCEEGKLRATKTQRKLYIKEYDVRDFLLRRRDKAQSFLRLFPPFRQFEEEIAGQVEDFFGDEPGCVIGLSPGGIPYALSLYFSLSAGKDINFVFLSEEQIYEADLIKGRKILIVDDSTRTGKSVETVKDELKRIKGLNLKEIKIAVYDDFAGCADFAAKREDFQNHLTALQRTLEQFRGINES